MTLRAVVLLSGGLDSAVTLAIAVRERGLAVSCLSFDYGQRHRSELACAARVAASLGALEHRVIRVDSSIVAGSALTGGGDVPKDRALEAEGIPATYVPARNALFLAHALSEAERIGAESIHIGANAVDYSGYPDCRPEFLEAFERMANLATKASVDGGLRLRVEAPLVSLSKAEIVSRGAALGVDFGLTSSCYDPEPTGRPCRACDSCRLRARGFACFLFDLSPGALPVAGALLFDLEGGPVPLTAGYACRRSFAAAAEAAWLEAAQSRLTEIHGAREDVLVGDRVEGAELLRALEGVKPRAPSRRVERRPLGQIVRGEVAVVQLGASPFVVKAVSPRLLASELL